MADAGALGSAAVRTAPAGVPLALALMAASGFAGLGAQIVWTQRCALWLGADAAAVLAVVGAFFGGLALGAWALGARIERGARPRAAYVACEAVIAGWCVLLVYALAPATAWLADLAGPAPSAARAWTIAFVGTFVLLLPATAAMGATLPAMARLLDARRPALPVAALYAANTGGAVLGVVGAAFWLVPSFGLAATALACAALNALCAVLAWAAFDDDPAPASSDRMPASLPLARLAVTGLLGIGYELLVVRQLSQVAENTVYTFAILLAVYLVGTTLGAAWLARRPAADAAARRDRLLLALTAAVLAGSALLWIARPANAMLASALGGSYAGALGAEALLAFAVFGLPTFVMGALFSHLAQEARGAGLGRAIGVNTLGAAAAAPLFGVLLLPAVGAKFALLALAAGTLALVSRAAWRRVPARAAAGAVVLAAVALPSLVIVDLPTGGRLVDWREGPTATVAVVEDGAGVQRLHIDNRQPEGSNATRRADARQALLPMLLHPAPRHALFVGMGTGVTAASAAREATLQVDVVELLPDVIAASRQFTADLLADGAASRLHPIAADARRHVRSAPRRYDLVVADNMHPARSGTGALYTAEHFGAVRARLAPGGVFCQWLPLHQMDLDTLRSIAAAFLVAFPDAQALLATNGLDTPTVGLVGRAGGTRFDPAVVQARLAGHALPEPPAAFGLGDVYAVLGSFAAGPTALTRFAAGATPNTDDLPVVAYRAPRITYAPDSRPRDRLLALLEAWTPDPDALAAGDAAFASRLGAYQRARRDFIAAGRDVVPDADPRRLLAQVRAPLLAVLRTSPDFAPAREPLLRLAAALERTDPEGARALLREVDALAPLR